MLDVDCQWIFGNSSLLQWLLLEAGLLLTTKNRAFPTVGASQCSPPSLWPRSDSCELLSLYSLLSLSHKCCTAHQHSLYNVGSSPKERVRPFHVLETLVTTSQSSRRTGPSSPPPELLLARVDTGRGAVCSALGR